VEATCLMAREACATAAGAKVGGSGGREGGPGGAGSWELRALGLRGLDSCKRSDQSQASLTHSLVTLPDLQLPLHSISSESQA
jgi:hypothetical protein